MNAGAGFIYWHQGMFLQPQHFQLAERSMHSLFAPYQRYLAPHFWGVCRATVRTSRLGLHTLEVADGSFLFPDGTYVETPGSAVVEPRVVPEGEVAKGGALTVYLGLRKWQEQAANVTVRDGDAASAVCTRYETDVEGFSCPDLHGGGPSAEVRQLSYVLRIFWETEIDQLGNYLLIPLTRLQLRGGEVEICPDYIPPCLTISAAPLLFELVREIRDRLAQSCRSLEGTKRQRSIQNADFGSRDLVYLFALRTLNRYLAQLDHVIQAGDVHPWHSYGALAQLAAELSCFSETTSCSAAANDEDSSLVLPPYNHLDLYGCFAQACDLILKLLGQISAGPDYALPLSYDGSYFHGELKPVHVERGNRFYLVVTSSEEHAPLAESLTSLAKLSSRERLPLLIAQALPGIPLEHLDAPPRELPRLSSSLYFAVDSGCEQWELVQKRCEIALFWDQAPPDLQVQLMIVNRT